MGPEKLVLDRGFDPVMVRVGFDVAVAILLLTASCYCMATATSSAFCPVAQAVTKDGASIVHWR